MTHFSNTNKPNRIQIFKERLRSLYLTIGFHIYLLQLENYELGRYWRVLWTARYFPRSYPWRKSIVWTPKLFLIVFLAVAVHIASSILFAYYVPFFNVPYVGLVIFCIAYPFFLSLAVVLIWPLDCIVKQRLIGRAARKINRFKNLKIIAIAGSFGKTTVKEVVAAVLSQNYKILVTPDNINTPLGIARLVLKDLTASTEILIVEMGEYYRGDIKKICALTPPDISVVTGINEAHLERLKTIENTAATIFEVVRFAKTDAVCVLNADDPNVLRYAPLYARKHKVAWYGNRNQNNNAVKISEVKFDQNLLQQTAFARLDAESVQIETKLLGSYAIGSCVAALTVGNILGLKLNAMAARLSQVKPVKHRLEPIKSASNVLVIDDSYNGNPAGVSEAVHLLNQFDRTRRRIFLTPGLVEMGNQTRSVHNQIGQDLASAVDLAILIKNSATPFIAEGLLKAGFAKDKIIWFNTALEAHAALKNILKPHDVILFQNDWGDNYI
ncbi:MAG: UDP-N-acetylmuramoyl-tripeptide--D-alanyl-D-alanine ligase [Candidatus Magasanikbacteria bacterium]|nr:UDP-N-acetylmuramoyl-tripeptide--D-alanyl-D-alanine ligase [Candidatus Magasanikbacteria bacterium]